MTGNDYVSPKARVCLLGLLAALSIFAYGLSLRLPFISDDYIQIGLARDYGPITGWTKLAADPLYRCRATSLVLTYWTERFFGLNPLAYNWTSVLVHVFNTWLVFGLGAWRMVGWRVSTAAAVFFAVYEGHQEAVMWYAALPELLVFFFALAGILAWTLWVQDDRKPRWLLAGSFALYLLALASKESAVAVVPVLLTVCALERAPMRTWLWTIPFAATAAVYTLASFAASTNHLHFNDGTFSLSAPFVWTLLNSTLRLHWPWGLTAAICLYVWRPRELRPVLLFSASWVIVTFLPYSFLTYMSRVPSRHTYFASAGLAIVVGVWLIDVHRRLQGRRAWITGSVAALLIAQNCGYLWTRKQQQFLARAEPTERLLQFARNVEGPVYVKCFPYDIWVARYALRVSLGKEALDAPSPADNVFCMQEPEAAAAN